MKQFGVFSENRYVNPTILRFCMQERKKIWLFSIYIAPALFLLLLSTSPNTFAFATKSSSPSLVIAYTNDTNGYLQACGCTTRQVGGLAKRATLIEKLRLDAQSHGDAFVLLDGGNLSNSLQKSAAVLESLQIMGCAAVAVAPLEEKLGAPFLRIADDLKTPFVSASAVASPLDAGGQSVRTFRVIQQGQFHIAVLVLPSNKIDITTWQKSMREAKQKSDLVFAFSSLPSLETRNLVNSLPSDSRPDTVVGYLPTAINSGESKQFAPIEGITYLPTATKGSVNILTAKHRISTSGEGTWSFHLEAKEVDEALPEDGKVATVVSTYFAHEAEALRFSSEKPSQDWHDLGFETATRCADCHSSSFQSWSLSKHARAARTLENVKKLVPDCLRCHSEVYRKKSAFRSDVAASWEGVSCATCHGSGILHTALRSKSSVIRSPGEQLCRTCHDPANDPSFNYEQYKERIRHW